jgi:hypothetical protein
VSSAHGKDGIQKSAPVAGDAALYTHMLCHARRRTLNGLPGGDARLLTPACDYPGAFDSGDLTAGELHSGGEPCSSVTYGAHKKQGWQHAGPDHAQASCNICCEKRKRRAKCHTTTAMKQLWRSPRPDTGQDCEQLIGSILGHAVRG